MARRPDSGWLIPCQSTRWLGVHDHLTHCLISTQYMSATGDAQSAFFQRMTGLGFAIMSLGYAKCGVSKDAWIKQTMIFHVGTCVEIELPELPGQRRVDGMGRLKFDFHTGRLDSDLLPPVRER